MRLLLIEHSDDLAAQFAATLGGMGHSVDRLASMDSAQIVLGQLAGSPGAYAAIVLDLDLPGKGGSGLVRTIRILDRCAPIVAIVACAGDDACAAMLRAGADDCLVKPIDFEDLAARLHRLLNRAVVPIALGHLVYDPSTRHLECLGRTVLLPARERDLADLLLRNAGHTVSRTVLENQIYGLGSDHGSNVVDVLIHRLRHRLAQAGAGIAIRTMRGTGFAMIANSVDQITCDNAT